MQKTLRNSMACGLAAIMTGILTACHITEAAIDTIARFFLRASPNSNSTLKQDNA